MHGDLEFTGFEYEEQFCDFIEHADIDPQDVCLSGSVAFAVRDIRPNNDIDLITGDTEIPVSRLPDFCDVTNNSFECLGVSDEQIIYDEEYHDIVRGLKIIRPELVFSYKHYHKREKDLDDLDRLQKYAFDNLEDWNWALVRYRGHRRFSSPKPKSLPRRIYGSIRHRGAVRTAQVGIRQYLLDPLQSITVTARKLTGVYRNDDLVEIIAAVPDILARECRAGGLGNAFWMGYLRLEENFQNTDATSKQEFIANLTPIEEWETIPVQLSIRGRLRTPSTFLVALFLGEDTVTIGFHDRVEHGDLDDLVAPAASRSDLRDQIDESRLDVLRRFGIVFYAILWPPVQDHFEDIERDIRNTVGVDVHHVNDLSFNLTEFEDFVRSLYASSPNPRWSTEKKIHEMRGYEKRLRVIEVEFEDPVIDGSSLSAARDLKREYRVKYKDEFDEYFHDIIMHMGDTYEENRMIRSLLRKYSKYDRVSTKNPYNGNAKRILSESPDNRPQNQ